MGRLSDVFPQLKGMPVDREVAPSSVTVERATLEELKAAAAAGREAHKRNLPLALASFGIRRAA
jgi:hypothetical protein